MSSATLDPIRGLINTLQAASKPPAAKVEHTVDPKRPNRIAYSITGRTRDAVYAEIDKLTAAVADGSGYANFVGPARYADGFFAIGQVVVYPVERVAEFEAPDAPGR